MSEVNVTAETICPCCPRGCSLSAPSCGRGKAYAARQAGGAQPVDEHSERTEHGAHGERGECAGRSSHGEHGERGEHGNRRRDAFSAAPDSLEGLLLRCGHALHHGGADRSGLFAALTEPEQAELRDLLKKLTASWENS